MMTKRSLLRTAFDGGASTATLGAEPRGGEGGGRWLLVYGPASSMRVPLPEIGDVVIGRGDDCGVVLDDRAASRSHARVRCDVGRLTLEDLGSHNGTLLNGRRIHEATALTAADMVMIGESCLVVYAPSRHSSRRRLDAVTFVRRVDELADRSRREAYLSFVAVLASAQGAALDARAERALFDALEPREDLGMLTEGGQAIAAPLEEQSIEARAAAWLEALGNSRDRVTIGIAVAPSDGADAATLLASARAAAEMAAPGEVAFARDAYVERKLDEKTTVVIADPSMLRAYELIDRLAKGTMPVLVRGETGSGKELAALALHLGSPRAQGPYRALNCAAVAEGVLESELFGHERGAFTGAATRRLGYFESAHGGTLFLDEVGELSLSAQAALLRVLETGTFTRVGSTRETAVDVRVVAATHRDLAAEVELGRFRRDLYFRIGAATVILPPLRERPREIPLLARVFLARTVARMDRSPVELSPLSLQAMLAHSWPGNARELRNVIEYAAALADGPYIEPWHLPALSESHMLPESGDEPKTVPEPRRNARDVTAPATKPSPMAQRPATLAEEIRELERMRIVEAMRDSAGVQTRAAERLGMPVRTLFAKLRAHAIDPKDFVSRQR